MYPKPHTPLYIRREGPNGIKVADAQDIADAYAEFGVELALAIGRQISIGYFGFDEFAEMQPTDTRDEIEENTHSVPFRLQRDILIRQHLVAVQEGEAIGVIGITLVSIRLPKERGRSTSEECSCLQCVGQLTAHTELRMLGEEYAQMCVERILRIGDG